MTNALPKTPLQQLLVERGVQVAAILRKRKTARSLVAGLCGSLAHSVLMYLKSILGLLPQFQRYEYLQRLMSHLMGTAIHPLAPWAISFLNGSVILGFLFGRLYRYLPAQSGLAKGAVFGCFGWLLMNLAFFPIVGEGLFATSIGLGIAPTLFSMAMLLAYSVTMGWAYSAFMPTR